MTTIKSEVSEVSEIEAKVQAIAKAIAEDVKERNPNDYRSSLKWSLAIDIAWGDYRGSSIEPSTVGVLNYINSTIQSYL